jgi:hypothetical protein
MERTISKFKELNQTDVNARTSYALSSAHSTQAQNIITNFITYFKAKHS